MTENPSSELKKDFIYGLLVAILAFAIAYIYGISTNILDNVDVFHSTVTTLLGLLFTILAIVYTFESQFKENRAVKILVENNQFFDVIQIFFHTVVVLSVVWLFTFILTVFELYLFLPNMVVEVLSLFAFVSFAVVIIRLWRCLEIFILLDRAVRKNS